MLSPISWQKLVRKFKRLGFSGPVPGGKHLFMVKDGQYYKIPNPHPGDISKDLLAEILRQADISRDEWNNA